MWCLKGWTPPSNRACLVGEGVCPPEVMGGPRTYCEFLDKLKSCERGAVYAEYNVDTGFDPYAAFDSMSSNMKFRKPGPTVDFDPIPIIEAIRGGLLERWMSPPGRRWRQKKNLPPV
jgi:hypothetical protein